MDVLAQILIVDDSGFSRAMMVRELTGLGIDASQIRQAGSMELNLNPNIALTPASGANPAMSPVAFDAPDPHQPSPWDQVDHSRRMEALKVALEGLTPRQRAMVLAYYVHERPVKQIAEDLGCAEGTVKATLFQSLSKLRKHLDVSHDPRP